MAHSPCMASADDILSSPGPTSLRVSSPRVVRAAIVVAPDPEDDDGQRWSLAGRDRSARRTSLANCPFPSHIPALLSHVWVG